MDICEWIAIKFGQDIHGPKRMEPNYSVDNLNLCSGSNISSSSQTFTRWIGTKFGRDIHGSKMMDPTDFADPATFPKCHQNFEI